MTEINSVRVRKSNVKTGTLDIKVTISLNKHTFGADEVILVGYNNDRPVWIQTTYKKSGIYKDFTYDQFIQYFIDTNSKSDGGGNEYEIIQEPWESKVPIWRKYGFDPYYLNNGAQIFINWNNWTDNMIVGGFTYSDSNGNEINTTSLINKTHWIIGIDDPSKEQNNLLHLTKNGEIDYRNKASDVKEYGGLVEDISIIGDIISAWKRKIPNYDELALCSPNNESCFIIPYKSPMKPFVPESDPMSVPIVATNKTPKESITVVIPDSIKVKIDTELKIFIGKNKELIENQNINQEDEITDLSDEYTEEPFVGSEEAPLDLKDIGISFDNVQETSSDNSYDPGNITPGKVVSLPSKYSHTTEQGFNLLNSQWIGDLITSALSHIGQPTYDIEGTEQGSLGCASAVSMMFYRSFGVHMKTGKSVKSNPKSIGDFGSKGTGELANWLSNSNLYTRISWQSAQPGDILNTARGSKAGHIGVVVNTKNDDGSWNVVSNSSKGFAGGGGGAVKQNYSVKKWQDVANRNPSGTFAYRYIGPKLSSGQVV